MSDAKSHSLPCAALMDVAQSKRFRQDDLREKSAWFMEHIVTRHPKVEIRVKPRRNVHRLLKTPLSDLSETSIVQEKELFLSRTITSNIPEAIEEGAEGRGQAPISNRSESHMKVIFIFIIQIEDLDSDAEDYGQIRWVANEDSTWSGFSHYYSAVSHSSGLQAIPDNEKDSGAELTATRQDSENFIGDSHSSVRDGGQDLRSPCLLHAPTPSIVLTLPTPRISQSPIFQPRSPITLAKYLQATSPRLGATAPSASIASLSSVPSLPSCDRCCLAQLEDGNICRSCERQWLACRMWYQANDGGRRRWLTEPLLRPAESNAAVRNVMSVLSVLGSAATVGLGLEPCQKNLPFEVVSTSICESGTSEEYASQGACLSGMTWWRHLSKDSLDTAGRARDALLAVVLASLGGLLRSLPRASCHSGGILYATFRTPYEFPGTSISAARITPYRRPHPQPQTSYDLASLV